MLARLKRTMLCKIRLMIYNSLVRPYFEYCIGVWGCSKASDLKVFFKLPKCVFATFWGLAIGPIQIHFLPAIRFKKKHGSGQVKITDPRSPSVLHFLPPLMNLF